MARADSRKVVPLFDEDIPDVRFAEALDAPALDPTPAATAAIDLSGKPKVWFLLGLGGSGKTVQARWLFDRMQGGSAAIIALDPTPTLNTWFHDVTFPAPGKKPGPWLASVLDQIAETKSSAIIDFGGGGETALTYCLEVEPNLHSYLEDAGIGLVACYCMTPRVEGLALIHRLERMGFQPSATAIVLSPAGNHDSFDVKPETFAATTRHPVYRDVLARGAVPIWIPPLEFEAMAEIERKRLSFSMARDGQVPDGAKFSPLGGLRRAGVGRWLRRMEQAYKPIETWLP